MLLNHFFSESYLNLNKPFIIKLQLIYQELRQAFEKSIEFDPIPLLTLKREEKLPVDYFEFYNAVSSVYSSKIEGEDIDYDSFFKYKFLNIEYKPDYNKRSNDLYQAYQFIKDKELTKSNLLLAHDILAMNLLPKSQRGVLRKNPMYVIGDDDKIEYVACDHYKLNSEFDSFFNDIEDMNNQELSALESFYYASMLHLVFVKIHPFQDGNGRTGRLLEKWFLLNQLGDIANAINLEKNYYKNRESYYKNIKRLGLEYDHLDYSKSLQFLTMTIQSVKE